MVEMRVAGIGLDAASRVEFNIEMALNAALGIPVGFAVANNAKPG